MAYSIGNNRFINPYNFISVDWNQTERKNIKDIKGRLSGRISCQITTKSPLAIPGDIIDCDENNHKTYDFMKTPSGEYMIPGSSIRGAIRSIYEAASDSCFVTAKKEKVFTRRAEARENGKPFLLSFQNGNWKVEEAERFLIIIDDEKYTPFNKPKFNSYIRWSYEELHRHDYGEKISFVPGEMYINQRGIKVGKVIKQIGTDVVGKADSNEGYLYVGSVPPTEFNKKQKKDLPQTKKHFESVFKKKDDGESYHIDQKKINSLMQLCKCYNDCSINRCLSDETPFYNGVYKLLSEKGQNIPVWYNEKSGMLSLASIGRMAYDKLMGDKLYEKVPCTSREQLCKACSLFGTANEEGKIGSKIRFTDAISDLGSGAKCKKNITLKELSSPKTSYVEFYTTGNGYDDDESKLRGRKIYWHSLKDGSYQHNQKTKRNSTMELVDSNNRFSFTVYFDSITEEQFNELVWVLTLGDNNEDGVHCHKIGQGKSIGLGSVKIVIKECKIRDFSEGIYSLVNKPLPKDIQCNTLISEACEELRIISDTTKTKDKEVSYPFIDNYKEGDKKTAPFQWFAQNKDRERGCHQEWQDIHNATDTCFHSLRFTYDPH